MSTHMPPHYLTNAQVFSLNEKHGWFEFGDAQSDVSRSFASEAIAMYERVRSAAPELLEALLALMPYAEHAEDCGDHDAYNNADVQTCGCGMDSAIELARAAIAKATGETP